MIGTEFLPGQGLGNRLFCYVTARCAALERGCDFATAGRQYLDADFLRLDMGIEVRDPGQLEHYQEKEERIYLPTSVHDMVHGCYVAGADPGVLQVSDNTLLYGNLQSETYFAAHRAQIREWLCVDPALDSHEYTADDLCVLNMRGSEYADDPALYLPRKYWTDAMALMRREHPGMRFMVVTEDTQTAQKLLPEIPAFHFGPAGDYVAVKNARYLIISNSSFAFFPAYTSDTVRKVIAPKYWARHNVSDGYWASEQNIYEDFLYMDRHGRLFTAEQCRRELAVYREKQERAGGRRRNAPWDPDSTAVAMVGRRNRFRMLARKAADRLHRQFYYKWGDR